MTTANAQSVDQSSSASSTYNSSDLKVNSGYDRLASSGLASLAENAIAIAQFVEDKIAKQTEAQKEAFKSQLNSQFTKFVDGLLAAPSSGQPGSQPGSKTVPQDSPPSQDLANQTCSDLGEIHAQYITNIFFMEKTINTIYWQYSNVRDVIVQQCQ